MVRCWGLMGTGEKKKYELGAKKYERYKEEHWSDLPEQEKAKRKEGLLRCFFTEVMDVPFENMTVMITAHYDEWLRFTFDDYWKLPKAFSGKRGKGHCTERGQPCPPAYYRKGKRL